MNYKNKKKIVTFYVDELIQLYIDRIMHDSDEKGTTYVMNKMISGYFLHKYGKEVRDAVRQTYTQNLFKEMDGE